MRTMIGLAGIMLLTLVGSAEAQKIEWKSVIPSVAAGFIMNDVDFPTPDRGYVTGWSGNNSLLITSTDGGDTWNGGQTSGVYYGDIEFTDAQNGIIVGSNATCNCGTVFATTNGGESWTPQEIAGAGALRSVDLINATTGFAVGKNATLLKTTDGGASWNPVYVAAGLGLNFNKVVFATPTVGFITAQTNGPTWPTKLLKTTDGGASWIKIQDYGDNGNNDQAFMDLSFIDDKTGIAAGRIDGGPAMFRTTDGGASWSKTFSDPSGPGLNSAYRTRFVDARNAYAVADYIFLRSTDGGASWKTEPPLKKSSLLGLAVIDTGNIIISGVIDGQEAVLFKRTVTTLPSASFSSTALNFGLVETESKEVSLTISAGNAAGLTVTSIAVQDGSGPPSGFTVTAPTGTLPINVMMGSPLTVTVRFTPGVSAKPKVLSTLAIETNDPARARVYISLSADQKQQEQPKPSATVDVSSLDFGKVEINTTKEMAFTLSAANAAGVRIDTFYFEDKSGNGDVVGLTVVEPPGPFPINVDQESPLTFTVRFAPVAKGDDVEADLVIETNDTQTPLRRIAISAESFEIPTTGVDRSTMESFSVEAHPNPIGASGLVTIRLAAPCRLNVALFDPLGRRIRTLFDAHSEAGAFTLPIEVADLPNGVYYCVADADGARVMTEITIAR